MKSSRHEVRKKSFSSTCRGRGEERRGRGREGRGGEREEKGREGKGREGGEGGEVPDRSATRVQVCYCKRTHVH